MATTTEREAMDRQQMQIASVERELAELRAELARDPWAPAETRRRLEADIRRAKVALAKAEGRSTWSGC